MLEAVSALLDSPMGKVLRPFDRLRRQRNNVEDPRQDAPRLTTDSRWVELAGRQPGH